MARSATAPGATDTPIGEAPAFLEMLAHVSQAAAIDRPVLVIGERGTGKELVAHRLTYLSTRWDRPFIKLNCAALSEQLLDSELFGHEAGAYTGAQRRRVSRFEMADGGTLFLDEIATASLAVQEKLLRVVEYGTFERVGGNEALQVDVRILAATNADLPALAEAGRFRADLLDRLAFDVVNVPPLRARPADILVLADHFARRMTSELKRAFFAGFGEAAKAELLAHDWPGNVRELRNVVERSVARAERPDRLLEQVVIDPFATGRRGRPVARRPAVPEAVEAVPVAAAEERTGDFLSATRAFEAQLLRQALEASRFSQKRAAASIGLTYYQFRHHLRVHGMLTGKRQTDAEADAA
jgi:psp operon transcriptional activator